MEDRPTYQHNPERPSYQHNPSVFYEHPPTERLDTMWRTVAKALYNAGYNSDYKESVNNRKLDELVSTIIFSFLRQSMEYMKEPEGEEAIKFVMSLLARAASKFVETNQAKVAIRVGAEEATKGLWDGCHRKVDDIAMKVPRVILWLVLLVVGAYGALLAVGLVLCLWRFSLYGLGHEKITL